MKKIALIILGTWLFSAADAQNITTSIPLEGNAYQTQGRGRMSIDNQGVSNWALPGTVSVFFHLSEPEQLDLALKAKGSSQLTVRFGEQTFPVTLGSSDYTIVPVGKIDVPKAGYVRIDIQSASKGTDGTFGEISELVVTNRKGKLTFVRGLSQETGGAAGAALFLSYRLPEDAEWFYSEMTVPAEGEQAGCYYAASGFDCGYIGLSWDTKRSVVFNVWNPDEKPGERVVSSEHVIKLVRKGDDVVHKELVQGVGGDCSFPYDWKAGETYRFLTRVSPSDDGNAVYSAYFYVPEENEWRLIASYLRPKAYAGYTYCFSMLKNQYSNMSWASREMKVSNLWSQSRTGAWKEVSEVIYTTDVPGLSELRLDNQAGLDENNELFLKSGGFFDDPTPEGTVFHRPSGSTPASLPNIEAIKQL